MWQAFWALLGAAVTVAGCYATGALAIDYLDARLRREERLPLAFVLGASLLHLAIFAVLALKIAYRPVLIAMMAAVIGAAVWRGSWKLKGESFAPLDNRLKVFGGAIFALFTVLYFFHAWAPESSPDGSGYHLGLVTRYLRVHGFEQVVTSMYANLSAGIEMLYFPAFAIGKHSSAALVHYAFLIALVMLMFAYGRRIGRPWVGAAGALLMYASPVVGLDGSIAYNDCGVAAIAFSVFYWLELWDEARAAKLLIPIGLLAGYCYAAKYTAFVMAIYALGFVVWKTRRVRPALIVAVCASAMVVPWVAKNWIYAANPVAPFFNKVFRNPYRHVVTDQEYTEYLSNYGVENKWTLPLEVTVRGQNTGGLIGPVFLLAPVAFLALRFREGRRLLLPGLVMLAPYMTNVGTRFLIPCLPFFSLAMALAVPWAPVLAAILVAHAWLSWPSHIPSYSAKYAWRLDRILWKQAIRKIPQDRYLSENFAGYGVARMIDDNAPKGARVLAVNGVADAYTSHEVLVGFQAALNDDLADVLNAGWDEIRQPERRRIFKFPARTVRRLRVLETAKGAPLEEFKVTELRFFFQGKELPREPEWKLRAWPNPWDVQMAFDNSPVTRWRSWETAWPGMYIDTDFGKYQMVDEVDLDTSPDYANLRLQVESMDASGQWVKIADDPRDEVLRPPPDIRRWASRELHERGIDYILMQDTDWGADDMREDPGSWGFKEIAKGHGARIYQVVTP
ncbi:MAG TPA: glycosyltransferase family 39 protein [Bryobacteraceae bacterium]|nr:glycosyltransferase family 39 protein [Bryobacteraceae bacterium]